MPIEPAFELLTDLNPAYPGNTDPKPLGADHLRGTKNVVAGLGVASETKGAAQVGFKGEGTGGASRTVQAKLRERVSLKDKGATADGAANDTTAVANAIAQVANTGVIETAGLFSLVTALDNPLGKRFVGGGGILITDSHGGTRRLDSYGDDGKVFTGKEYLYRLFLRIRNGGTLTGFIYGDSTVATSGGGGGYAGADFEPHTLLADMLSRRKGVRNTISLTNRGVGGTKWTDLSAIADIDTVGGSTDLFIIKYGINDAADGLAAFATNMRAKLAAIRASSAYGTVDNLAIVLVGPNATYDPGHGRSSTWYEQIRQVYVQAARDYQCAFFDAYAYLRDVTWAATAAGSLMMDNPFADGQSVHPKEIMQNLLWAGLCDNLIGASDLGAWASDAWVSLTMQNSWVHYGAPFATPQLSMAADGWVSLKGLIKSGTVLAGTSVAILPSSIYYPLATEIFECAASGGRCSLRVTAAGAIEQQDGSASATYTSLSGIRYKARG